MDEENKEQEVVFTSLDEFKAWAEANADLTPVPFLVGVKTVDGQEVRQNLNATLEDAENFFAPAESSQ